MKKNIVLLIFILSGVVIAQQQEYYYYIKKPSGTPCVLKAVGFSNPVAVDSSYITIVWEDVGADTYKLIIGSDTFTTANTYQEYGPINAGVGYIYWVASLCGLASVESAFIFVAGNAPSSFDLTTPANLSTDISVEINLEWHASNDATRYYVEVSQVVDFSTAILRTTTAGQSYGLSGLDFGTVYYWRVTAINGIAETMCSQTFSFTTGGGEQGI